MEIQGCPMASCPPGEASRDLGGEQRRACAPEPDFAECREERADIRPGSEKRCRFRFLGVPVKEVDIEVGEVGGSCKADKTSSVLATWAPSIPCVKATRNNTAQSSLMSLSFRACCFSESKRSKQTCNFSSIVPSESAESPQASSAKANFPTSKASSFLNNRSHNSGGNSGTVRLTSSVKTSRLRPWPDVETREPEQLLGRTTVRVGPDGRLVVLPWSCATYFSSSVRSCVISCTVKCVRFAKLMSCSS
mmetsp:Transcript_65973/g.143091  ORF Transcript_65973/g.143091 Transcript_65973/m.143091 type:complete len:249 (-) Transcript_65973:1474-2220(-)